MAADLVESFGRRVRLGLVGGGADSVIGRTHLMAMRADGLCELVAGAMSVDPAIARSSGQHELLAPDRIYTDWRVMLETESSRPDRIDAVVIATPPRLHLPIAKAFLERGFDVICEKPLAHDLGEAKALDAAVRESGRLFCLTHCYTGYPMVRQARAMIEAGAIGKVRLVDAEFSVGTPAIANDPQDLNQRHWRFRRDQAGIAGLLGETGSHAYHMVSFVTGLHAESVSALMHTFADRREVYDNAYLTARFENGAQGRMWYSYVAAGHDHGLTLRIYGETGSLVWWQEEGEILWHRPMGRPAVRFARGYDDVSESARIATRISAGHPEGYVLAFANLYRQFATALMARQLGRPFEQYLATLPSVQDGVRGMAFIEAATRSQEDSGAWTRVPE